MLRAAIHNKAMRNTHEGRTLPTTLIFSSGKVDVMNRSVRVLHVDDEPRFTGLTTTHLQRIDDRYVVETAESVTEGLDRLADGRFDCVVSDYDMPGKNGIDFLEAVRESDPNLPFILFTGKGSEEVASDAISAGVTDYLQKDTATEQFELLANRIENAVSQHRTEHELEQQRIVLETVIENLPAGILVEDESREVLTANTELLELFGDDVSVEEFVGADCAQLARELKDVFVRSEEFLASIEDHLDAREPVIGETFELADGRIVERDYIPYELPSGAANLWMYRDVTDDREQTRLLEGLFEQSLHGISIKEIITDEEGTPVDYEYLHVNDQFEELTGLDGDAIVGRRATEAIDGIEDTGFIETFGEVALGGEPKRFESYSEPLDRHYEISVFSPTDERFITIFSDITERKARQKELEKFKFFVEHTPDFMIILEEDLTVRYQSPISPAVEYEPLVITADDPIQYIHPEDRNATVSGFQQSLDNPDEVVTSEFRAKDAEGTWRWFETRSQNFIGTEPIDGVLVTIREVTERKEKERRLQRQNERLDQFASVVSHDLRNPLNVADGRLDLLAEDCDSEHVAEIEWALDRMDQLIDDVLTLARDGETVGKTDPVALDALVVQCWSNVATGEATLTCETSGEIRADRSRLSQLLENLFRNSVEHNARPVTITVGDLSDGFYIEDDGRGIPAAEREAVFEAGHTSTEDGTGFGLAIVAEIASAHGWEVDVTGSTAGGARFEITGVEQVE